ncbi:LuxR C-terminal-related transcriptional regulator [Paenibacillus cisolokensis]|uniref:LuxR C-terminal-related transcriptional regulator n=1 Tax=Paenibacillus cisolokensis TaxID=1658519 RepID=UPI003D2B6599
MAGTGNRSISTAMSISMETVIRHCRHIYRKLGVRNRKQLAEQYSNRGEDKEPFTLRETSSARSSAN